MTNTGTENPATEKAIRMRSNQPPWRQAASTPSGIATATTPRTGIVAATRRARNSISSAARSVLLDVPVQVAGPGDEARDVLAGGQRVHVLAQRRVRADLERARLDLLGKRLLLRLVGL